MATRPPGPPRRSAPRARAQDDSLTQYLREIQRYPLLAADDERHVAERARAGDAESIEALVRANLRFVVAEAKRYRQWGVSLEDLISEGNLGLLAAARRFDPTRGVRFISYAAWWVRQAILAAVAASGPLVRVPARRVAAVRDAERASDGPTRVRQPNGSAVARAAREHVRTVCRTPLSLDADVADAGGATLGETVADTRLPPPEDAVCSADLATSIEEALRELAVRDAEILRLHFGLDARGQYTTEEIARLLGLSAAQVSHHRERALAQLRQTRRGRALATFAA